MLKLGALFFGAISTIIAVTGDTYTRIDGIFRLTRRGRISIVALLIALACGGLTEFGAQREAERANRLAGEADAQRLRIEELTAVSAERLETISILTTRQAELLTNQSELTAEITRILDTPPVKFDRRTSETDGLVYELHNVGLRPATEVDIAPRYLLTADISVPPSSPTGSHATSIHQFELPSDGTIPGIGRDGRMLFSFDGGAVTLGLKEIREAFLSEFEEKKPEGVTKQAGLELSLYVCSPVTASDGFGGTYQTFMSLRVFLTSYKFIPELQDMHLSPKLYKDCADDLDNRALPLGDVERYIVREGGWVEGVTVAILDPALRIARN